MLHQKVRSVKVGDLSQEDKAKHGLVGVADSELVAITISEETPSLVATPPASPVPPAVEPQAEPG